MREQLYRIMKYNHFIVLLLSLFMRNTASGQQKSDSIILIGAMRNVMWKGELSGKIALDTISNKKNLYGLGPVEFLRGEIIILDGKPYLSTVLSDSSMQVRETYYIKAPFFGYAHIPSWKASALPDSIQSIPQLEHYLDNLTQTISRPFFFRLEGIVETAIIHIVNLPDGSTVRSPAEAHVGQVNYPLRNEQAVILGFFSTEHKTIFTHHDSFLHMHLISSDKKKMGHLDSVTFKKGSIKLYLPNQN